MAKFSFDPAFEKRFVDVCSASSSLAQAAVELGMNYKTVRTHAKRLNCFKTNQSGKGMRKKSPSVSLEQILNGSHRTYQSHKLKKRLLGEGYKDYKCEKCGLMEWLGKPIPLELHHNDGNRYNNRFVNLTLLCPNCHALTENYRAKNISNLSALRETGDVEPLKLGEAFAIYGMVIPSQVLLPGEKV